ncbi:Phosphoinositide 3-kinase regulatory subunit 4 [Sarcoptes scabiei]|uniref:non-specific serine/threonine protein kinase n=1 Tax=Sarcoptes scabiei TaxID=52283 RepID=A0A834RDP9_SARSC|nr:Phosphoinositide 3-kinase regulatory subunit 4 [Sarcoptes scabiei]
MNNHRLVQSVEKETTVNDADPTFFNMFLPEGTLNQKMDMFSLGCILAEIYSDNFLFDLSELLNYKEKNSTTTAESIQKIQNCHIQAIVKNLLSIDPNDRLDCASVLQNLKGTFFPVYFDELYLLMNNLIRLPPDARIQLLSEDIDYYLSIIIKENPKGILLLLITITSSMRSLKHIHCKLEAQRLVCKMTASSIYLEPYIIDRLIPYMVDFLNDSDHRVRGQAIHSIIQLLEQVHRIPSSDNNLFTDYLLEKLQKCITEEKSAYVRMCMATIIGRLSDKAISFLDQYQDHNYDEELNLLHKYFQNLVSTLITDPVNCVRRFLLSTPKNCAKLCAFFGRQKTNEMILSHIITFLNDKNDFKLRLSFFDNIVVIASYLGIQCSSILHPLLQQGLCDPEEIVIAKSIEAIASLTEQDLLAKPAIYDLLKEMLPLIYLPNVWIKNSISHFLSIINSRISLVDLNIKVLPMMEPYFKMDYDYFSEEISQKCLTTKPISRAIFEIVLSAKEQEILNEFFEKLALKLKQSEYDRSSLNKNPIYKRLMIETMTEDIEEKILTLYPILIKIFRNRKTLTSMQSNEKFDYQIVVNKNCYYERFREINLIESTPMNSHEMISSGANQEWLHMFGPNDQESSMDKLKQRQNRTAMTYEHHINDFDVMFLECPPFLRDLRLLNHYRQSSSAQINLSMEYYQSRVGFLSGHLVAYCCEHQSTINRMTKIMDSNLFVTASDDGTIKLWDMCDDSSDYIFARSRCQYNFKLPNDSPNNLIDIISCSNYLITCTDDCFLHVLELENSSLKLLCSFKVSLDQSEIQPLITSICSLNEKLFAVSLTDSSINVYDVRYLHSNIFNVPVMKFYVPSNQRLITCIDGNDFVLFASTASGHIAGFDLRFKLRISDYVHKDSEIIHISRIKYSPSGLFSSVYGTDEITLWDYRIGQKSKILSPSSVPSSSLFDQQTNIAAVNAMLPVELDSSTSRAIMTAGSDMRIRCWNLDFPEESFIINDPLFRSCDFCQSDKMIITQKEDNQDQDDSGLEDSAISNSFNGSINSVSSHNISKASSNLNLYPKKNKFLTKSLSSSAYSSIASSALSSSSSSFTTKSSTFRNSKSESSYNSSQYNESNEGRQRKTNTSYEFQQIYQEDGIIRIQEKGIWPNYNQYLSLHQCSLDQYPGLSVHQDSIIDLITCNNYLVSCGRSGTIKVWR